MADKLSEDQEKRIAATLSRLRAGLARSQPDHAAEPSHIFRPQVYHDPSK